MNKRFLRVSLGAVAVIGLGACAITPLPTDKEVTVLSVEASEWSPKTNTIGGPLLGAGALAGSLITQVAKAIVIDEVVAEAIQSSADKPTSIYDANHCWVQVQMPEGHPRSFMMGCKYLIESNRHKPGATVWLRYDSKGEPYPIYPK